MQQQPVFWVVWRFGGATPTVSHPSLAKATEEAERLAAKQPGDIFFVLQAVDGRVANVVQPIEILQPEG